MNNQWKRSRGRKEAAFNPSVLSETVCCSREMETPAAGEDSLEGGVHTMANPNTFGPWRNHGKRGLSGHDCGPVIDAPWISRWFDCFIWTRWIGSGINNIFAFICSTGLFDEDSLARCRIL